ncbi:MAG: hypothetical protein DCC68_13625 [Planctomycetota bacterium]|nr:MAG: hypothetical protein DCC68_13625 [Planctomycetota bacterium]
MAVLLVLVVLGISLVMAYGLMRVQSTAEQVQSNSIRRGDARQAAMTGLSVGLRKMHETGWTIAQTVSAALNATDRYVVTYATGDPDLTSNPGAVTDADIATRPELLYYPFRVTITAKGYSRDPGTGIEATHSARAVVELAPQKLATQPTNWGKITDTTRNVAVYQRDNDDFDVNMPFQVRGNARIHGSVALNGDYNSWTSIGSDYLEGLRDMRNSDPANDDRPFTGRLYWKESRQSAGIINWIANKLSLSRTDLNDEIVPAVLDIPTTPTYQLYPGGEVYSAVEIANDVAAGATPIAAPLKNPLRVMYRSNDVRLGNNVSLQGTLVVGGTSGLTLDGTNIRIEPAPIPKLAGQTTTLELPSIVASNVHHNGGRSAVLKGLVFVDSDFRIESGSQTTAFDLTGRLVAKDIRIRDRTEWTNASWGNLLNLLDPLGLLRSAGLLQDSSLPPGGKTHYNADYDPRIIFQPYTIPTAVTNHWHGAILRNEPLYQEQSAGSGLRWNVISWKDNL